jgi:hypothetical protein
MHIDYQWFDPDRIFCLLRSDTVPGDVLDIGGVPIEPTHFQAGHLSSPREMD